MSTSSSPPPDPAAGDLAHPGEPTTVGDTAVGDRAFGDTAVGDTAVGDRAVRDVVVSRAASSGAATWAMGSLFERLAGAAETGGQLGASIVTQPPGTASPLHVHTREAEAWYLLEGEMIYRAGERLVEMAAGDFIYLPRNVPHAFRTLGVRPARLLALSLPGHLLDLYDEVGRPATERTVPDGGIPASDIARWIELSGGYGIRIVGPPIPVPGPAHPAAGPGPRRSAIRVSPGPSG